MKLYFAGMETAHSYHYRQFLPTDNFFGTYFYSKKCDEMFKHINISNHKGLITIDSGAHSFFGFLGMSVVHNDNNKNQDEMPDPHEYFNNYLNWIEANYDKASYFVELDLQEIVGQDTVWDWREQYKKRGVYDKIITVHHSGNKPEHFQEMIKHSQSKYIGLEGLRDGKIKLPYMELLKEAYHKQIKVHGFALTNQKLISKYPFYSVDSSSWTAVNRYGVLFKFDKRGRMRQTRTTKEAFFKHGFDLRQATWFRDKPDQHNKLAASQIEFRKMEEFYTKVWEKRGVHWKD